MTPDHHPLEQDPTALRVEIARSVVARLREELGEHLLAAAAYGSVAHNAALLYSDVELAIITDDTVEYGDHWLLERGMMVEYTLVAATRMLAAARRVEPQWGMEADQYRRHVVIYDPDDFFPRCHAAATDLAPQAFVAALAQSWWSAYEMRGKFRNALLVGDLARIHYSAWQFAYSAALRIALYERQPYESGRTLWNDAAERGYGMRALIDALASSEIGSIEHTLENVWDAMMQWGAPDVYRQQASGGPL